MNKIIECFKSIQGEGLRTGRPSVFIRFSGCNLRCVFRDDTGKVASCCDTPYASFDTANNNKQYNLQDILNILKENPQIEDLVITGGEPLLNLDLYEIILAIKNEKKDIVVTVETNGTITPSSNLLSVVDLWSVSPKLSTSVPTEKDSKKYGITESQILNHFNRRINLDALCTFIEHGKDCQIKFVYTGNNCLNEIKELINDIQESVSFNVNDFIMLMPEGVTKKSILDKSPEVVDVCVENGWTFSSRMHILIWGNVKEK